MERNTLAAVLGGLALLAAVPVSVRAEAVSVCRVHKRTVLQAETADLILRAVEEALEQETPDIGSQVMKDFLTASDLYDNMNAEEQKEIPQDIRQGILTVRTRIGNMICSREGITPVYEEGDEGYAEKNWYVQMETAEGRDKAVVLSKVKEMYEGSAPELIYHKEISYKDIRSGETHIHWDMFALSFPVPQGYDRLISPRVLTYTDGKLEDLGAERRGDRFYVDSAMFLENIIVVDLPVALTGILLDTEACVNQGQKVTVKAAPLPAGATEKYSLEWESSDRAVAEVTGEGVVTGVGAGTCTLTASVAGKERMQASCKITVVEGVHPLPVSVSQALRETKRYILSVDKEPTIGSEWFVVGLARGGMDTQEGYFRKYYNHFANYLAEKKGILTKSAKYTEYSKAALAMTAMGKDARDIAGYDLFRPLADLADVKAQGINGPVWALIAMNSDPAYVIPEVPGVEEQTTEESLIGYILQSRTPKGGWSMEGQSPDPDMTAMALQALSFYYQKPGHENVTEAVDGALGLLSTMQRSTGGYASMGAETVESCVQVITALCMLGIDPGEDERFVKGGYWTIENLLTYRVEGGGFMHVKEGGNGGAQAGEVNGMSTEQAYYALVAYQRLKEGKTGLYDMSDVEIEKGGEGDGRGTGLETPVETPTPASAATSTPAPGSVSPSPDPVNRSVSDPSIPQERRSVQTGRPAAVSSGDTVGKTLKTVSGNTPRKKRKARTVSGGEEGWDIQMEGYGGDEAGWDSGAEMLPVNEEIPPMFQEEHKESIPPFAMGILGGVFGAGSLEGARILYRRKRK